MICRSITESRNRRNILCPTLSELSILFSSCSAFLSTSFVVHSTFLPCKKSCFKTKTKKHLSVVIMTNIYCFNEILFHIIIRYFHVIITHFLALTRYKIITFLQEMFTSSGYYISYLIKTNFSRYNIVWNVYVLLKQDKDHVWKCFESWI